MATYLDLPYELLYDTLRLAMPEDLENFAQISKRVQEMAKPLLTDHRALIRKYRCFKSWFNGGKATLLLLQNILTTPYIGPHVREANVDFDRGSLNPEIYTEPEIELLCNMVVESMVLASEVANATAVRSLLTHAESSQCESAAFALLLPRLPNLEELCIKDSWRSSEPWVTHVLDKAPRATKPFLTKLARVSLSYDPHSASACVNRLQSYAALPSVKELSASDITKMWRYGDNHLPWLASDVTKLELRANEHEADANGFCSFLRGFPKLEVFKLSCVGPSTVEPSLIKDILLLTVKTTLRKLTILADGGCQSFMGSLRGFEVLTELHTNWPLLIERDRKPKELLPASLQHLKLDDSRIHCAGTCKEVLRDVLCGNELGDLHLKDVTFVMPEIEILGNSYRCLQKYCYEQGLTLTLERRGM